MTSLLAERPRAPAGPVPTVRCAHRRLWLLAVATGWIAIGLGAQTAPLPATEPVLLEAGKTIEGQLSGGQSHKFQFLLQRGQYARVSVEQLNINVALVCVGPDGNEVFAADNSTIGDTEAAELIGHLSGRYQIQVTAPEAHAPSGRYQITLGGIELATERHRMRVSAIRALSQAMKSYRQGTREAMLTAIGQFDGALAGWKSAQARSEEATTLLFMALTHIELGERQKALDFATEGLAAAQASRDRRTEGRAYDSIGEVYNYFGDKVKAIEYYNQAIPLMRAVHDRAGEGNTLNNLGVAYARTGEKRKALDHYDAARQIFGELQDRRMLAEVAGNIGLTYDNLGEYQLALDCHQQDLALKRELGDRPSEAITLNNIGSAYSGLAEYQKALDAYNAALEINRSLDNRWNTAINLNNIAWVYASLGDRRRALSVYQEALAIFRAIQDQRRIATALNNIAEIYADLGDYRKAVEVHNQALPLRRSTADPDGEANSLSNLAKSYGKLGQAEKARNHFERALAILRAAENRYMLGRTLRSLGALDREDGYPERASSSLDEALQISRAIHDQSGEAAALAELARVQRDRGNLAGTRQRAEEALAVLESLRLAVSSPQLRASLFASARDVQELEIEVLMRLHAEQPREGFDAAALLASERGRARSLLEMLSESGAEIRRGVDATLLARERELERLISGKAEQQTRLLSGKHSEAEATTAAKELDVLTRDFEQIQSRIRQTSPQYAALTQPSPLGLNQIQTQVLDGDTVLLEYSLGTQKSFLWSVTPSSIDTFELPPRAEIEAAATRVYQLLTARNQKPANENPVARARRVRQADGEYIVAAAKASRMLLGPAASQIANKRLLIVGEGVLQYLPFAALPEPADENPKPVPLIVNHEIVTAPSASVMAVLRQETAGRSSAEKTVAILADPVFSASDARITQQRKQPMVTPVPQDSLPAEVTRSGPDLGAQEFVRLRFSRTEAEEIAKLAPAEGTLKALDFDASRDTVLRTDLRQYRIVHFATHSLLNNEHPELSGVVLSLVDRSGRPQNGFLRLYDIYNLRLGSDLVVLSACQTALGGEIKGEGLIGLTRGFLYAGAARVVATLWEVDDRTTAEAMKHFYEGVLARGEKPATALRAAQVALSRAKGWEAPFYWGAFTLVGEWR